MGEKDVKTTKNTAKITTNAQISTSRVLQGFSKGSLLLLRKKERTHGMMMVRARLNLIASSSHHIIFSRTYLPICDLTFCYNTDRP